MIRTYSTIGCRQTTNQKAKRPCPFETLHYAKNTGTSAPVCDCDCNKRSDTQTTQRSVTRNPTLHRNTSSTVFCNNTLQQHYSIRLYKKLSTANTSLDFTTLHPRKSPRHHHTTKSPPQPTKSSQPTLKP